MTETIEIDKKLRVKQWNPAAEKIEDISAGIIMSPENLSDLTDAVTNLLNDSEKADAMGAAGRKYAEQNFDIHPIKEKFTSIINSSMDRAAKTPTS